MFHLEKRLPGVFPFLLSLFWGGWIIIVSFTDTIDCLQTLGYLSPYLPMSSHNFQFLKNFTALYQWHETTLIFIYQCIILASYLLAMLFLYQLYKFTQTKDVNCFKIFHLALIGLTTFFILADEIFINFEVEHAHLLRLNAQLLSLSFFYIIKTDPNLAKD
jgi:hypothetical protein